MTVDTPESLKEEGNAHYREERYLKAAATFTKAIKLDPENAVMYSNRAAAFFMLNKFSKALADAEVAVKLKPTWEKGYFRQGCALEGLDKKEEALVAFRHAAECNPKNTEVASKISSLTKILQQSKKKAAGEAVKSDEAYDKLVENLEPGAEIPYSKARVEAWAKEMVFNATNEWIAGGLSPTVHFLAGRTSKNGADDAQGQVAVKEAFKSPEMLANCCDFLRKYATDFAHHASCCVVAKQDITFPSVWLKEKIGKIEGWPCGTDDGFFVQVESRDVKMMWFVPHTEKDKKRGRPIPKDPVSLDVDNFRLLPPLTDGATD